MITKIIIIIIIKHKFYIVIIINKFSIYRDVSVISSPAEQKKYKKLRELVEG